MKVWEITWGYKNHPGCFSVIHVLAESFDEAVKKAKEWKAELWRDYEELEITDVRRVCSVDVE